MIVMWKRCGVVEAKSPKNEDDKNVRKHPDGKIAWRWEGANLMETLQGSCKRAIQTSSDGRGLFPADRAGCLHVPKVVSTHNDTSEIK